MIKSYVFPGDIDEQIASIGAKPFIYMRTDEFSGINLESERMLLELIHCSAGRTIIYTGSGTGAMSAVVENYVSTRSKAFVVDGGSFGHRWYDLCLYYGLPAVDYKVEFGKDLDYVALESALAGSGADTLLVQHHETSSGVLFDIRRIGEICRRLGVSLVVDVISSFLAEDFSMDEVGADICITSTQKGLNIPPGLSVIFLSSRLEGYSFAHRGYYWDFEDNLKNLRRGQTPFSPATTIFLQLHARLLQLKAEGGESANIERVHHRAEVFRTECRKYGWEMPAERPSAAITAIRSAGCNIFFTVECHRTVAALTGLYGNARLIHKGCCHLRPPPVFLLFYFFRKMR